LRTRSGLFFFFSCALSALLAGCSSTPSTAAGFSAGHPYSVALPRLGGGTAQLLGHPGHVVLASLWAVWCPACREELPALAAYARHAPRDVLVYAIDQGEDPQTIAPIVRGLGLTVLLDRDQRYGAAYVRLGLPTTVVLDRHGLLRAVIAGASTEADFAAAVRRAEAAR